MPTKPNTLFIIGFTLITLLNMASETLAIRWLNYGSKPLIMGLLFCYVGQNYRRARSTGAGRWLLVGMAFALLGDIFLMIKEVDLFAPGLGAFLLMQVCYCRVFWFVIRLSGRTVTTQSIGKVAWPFVAYGMAFLVVLYPVFSENPHLTPLWWPVISYTICLCSMGLLATRSGPLQWRNGLQTGSVGVGALLFILSDSIIAINKFLSPVPATTWLVMSTYAAAQYLIVVGILHRLARLVPARARVVVE